ncbi:MAG: NAD(P)/FAD-dependent oxidoreductase [Oscillibacter sp.]|jgi:NADPH-dependent 2,4-dienoyl-CoA reductase/sulfur reductase-like enzyme|nr:NAD(P)/FAD-dependent oxidoreductase [Oscillibacter sp.]
MREMKYDVAVIGAGPGGLAAAAAAKKQGAGKVLIIERDTAAGGILQQCIHAGFGLTYFNEELTGPEYAGRFAKRAEEAGAELMTDTMVLKLSEDGSVVCSNPQSGVIRVHAGAVVLAMGCRERTRFNLKIPGTRPAGIYTAGTAQRLINRQNEMVGKKIVILGSGDIGMIMARRMTLEGAQVEAVVEIMSYLAGLTRNKVQCLDDFGIPLLLEHTVTRIVGERRIEGVWIAAVDAHKKPLPETEHFIACDTLLLSVGLLPENELTRAAGIVMSPVTNGPEVNQYMQTSCPAVFACGNVVHVNDLADNVSTESELAGTAAAQYAAGTLPAAEGFAHCLPGRGVRYVCPQHIAVHAGSCPVRLYFRVLSPGGKTNLRAVCGQQILAERTVLRVSPGEMEHLDLDAAELGNQEIRVEAEEAER